MPSNEHHTWLTMRDWLAVEGAMLAPNRDAKMLKRKYSERDEHGRLPHHWMAAKAQAHTHVLAFVGVQSICNNLQALTTRDKEGKTPIDIAHKSGACAEIIGLLSLTPEEVRSLGMKGLYRLYAPVGYWTREMCLWIRTRSYADCHKFIDEHDDELVREVLEYYNSTLLRNVACSQVYSESLVFLALRMIHRYPLSLSAEDPIHSQTALQRAQDPQFNACQEILQILSLDPSYITSTPFSALLLHSLPTKYHEIFGTYNTVCDFLRRTVSPNDKAALTQFNRMRIFCDTAHIAHTIMYDLNHNMSLGRSICGQVLAYLIPKPR